ncbi:MAG: membrane dipeptidase, partial [Thermoanaerobaculia bacterium]
ENNKICDSSTAKEKKWGGLSPYGKELIKEMNRMGIVIDVSHASDKTVLDVLEISKAPIIASHSCVREINPIPRNISDELIKKIAQKGGIVMVNFYAGFLDKGWEEKSHKVYQELEPIREELKKKYGDDKNGYYKEIFEIWKKKAPPAPKIDKLIEHIEHIIKIAGIDAVGIGSDFEGAGTFMDNLKDVSELPNLTCELLKRGYSKKDMEKILGGNFLRVLKEVERNRFAF